MNISFSDQGAVATITITSSVFEFREHNRCVDAALLSSNVHAASSGFFLLKTVISGKSPMALRAYKAAVREEARHA